MQSLGRGAAVLVLLFLFLLGVNGLSDGFRNVLEESDREQALALIRDGKDLAQQCKALIRKIAESDYDAATVTALTLGARYYKRVGGHVLNILSSVVMPLHKVDYYDEASMLADLRRQV